MNLLILLLFSSAFLSMPRQDSLAGELEGLRDADLAVAKVLFRLSSANDELCLKHAALTGLVLHSSTDYNAAIRNEVIRHFALDSAIGVEGVVHGSPAERAGIETDDSVTAIGDVGMTAAESRGQALAALDRVKPGEPLRIALVRRGQPLTVTMQPVEGCAARVEVVVSDRLNAATDGDTIQVNSALVNLVGGDEQALAAVLGHELSHIVLDHPRRLTAAHVNRGLLRILDKSGRLIRQTEDEADRLSVTLLANAGYDPQAAVRYWLTYGPDLNASGGLGSVHATWRERADAIAAAAAAIPHDAARPIVPAWIASRSQPLR